MKTALLGFHFLQVHPELGNLECKLQTAATVIISLNDLRERTQTVASRGSLEAPRGSLEAPRGFLQTPRGSLEAPRGSLGAWEAPSVINFDCENVKLFATIHSKCQCYFLLLGDITADRK